MSDKAMTRRHPGSFHSVFLGCEPVLIIQNSCQSTSLHLSIPGNKMEEVEGKMECILLLRTFPGNFTRL